MKLQRKSSIFLMELIISILFFALCSAVCIQLFVYSNTLGNESFDRDHAVTKASSIAEVIIANNGETEPLFDIFPMVKEDVYIVTYYDEDGEFVSKEEGDYELQVLVKEQDGMKDITISTYLKGEEKVIYELNTKVYNPKTVGGGQ